MVTEVQSQAQIHGRVSDIGVGGCYIDMLNPFAVGSTVDLKLIHGDKAFHAQAIVLYTLSGLGMGLSFTRMGSEDLEVLRSWLGELAGERLSPADTAKTAMDSSAVQVHQEFLQALVRLLRQKRVLTEQESQALLSKLSS